MKKDKQDNKKHLKTTCLHEKIHCFNHELLQPLQVIMGYTQMLMMELPQCPGTIKKLDSILIQVKRIQTLNSSLYQTAKTHQEKSRQGRMPS